MSKRDNERLIAELEAIKKNLEAQRGIIEGVRREGRLPPDLVPERLTRPGELAAGEAPFQVDPVPGTRPTQFIARGRTGAIPDGRTRWIGTQSGLEFWPQIELRADEQFMHRITIPSNVTSGAVILVEAGSESSKWFAERLGGRLRDIGVYLPHLNDVEVRYRVNFRN